MLYLYHIDTRDCKCIEVLISVDSTVTYKLKKSVLFGHKLVTYIRELLNPIAKRTPCTHAKWLGKQDQTRSKREFPYPYHR